MVLGSLDENIELTTDLENSIWKDANLVESRATSAFGLALAARKRGYKATVYADSDGIGFTKRLKKHFPIINVERMNEFHNLTRRKALELGVKEIKKKVTVELLKAQLENGINPIVLISSKLMGEWIAIPHWIVVTDIERDALTIHNPETAMVERYTIKRFAKFIGFTGNTRMVCIERLQ
jgi:hypothetical protein